MSYVHYYYCPHCHKRAGLAEPAKTDTYSAAKYNEYRRLEVYAPIPAKPTKAIQHFELDRANGCARYLKYLCTISTGPPPLALSSVIDQAQTKVQAMSVHAHAPQGVVCVAYDPSTQLWSKGYSGDKDRVYSDLPSSLLNQIKDVYDSEKFIYGRGCAEVDAVDKIFAKRVSMGVTDTSLKNCVFAARNKRNLEYRQMCNNCKEWLLSSPIAGKAIDAVARSSSGWL